MGLSTSLIIKQNLPYSPALCKPRARGLRKGPVGEPDGSKPVKTSTCRGLKKVSKVNQDQLDFLIVSYPGNMFINLYCFGDQGKNRKNNLLKYLKKIR
jgi:hypothetical protein